MTQIVLVAHAPLASALMAVAKHVYPGCASMLQALDVEPDVSPDLVEAKLRHMVRGHESEGVLFMVDTFGATPCNVAQRLADGSRVRIVSGVNVPMLWRTLCYGVEPIDTLISRAINGATQGIMHVAVPRPQNQSAVTAVPSRDDHDSSPGQQ